MGTQARVHTHRHTQAHTKRSLSSWTWSPGIPVCAHPRPSLCPGTPLRGPPTSSGVTSSGKPPLALLPPSNPPKCSALLKTECLKPSPRCQHGPQSPPQKPKWECAPPEITQENPENTGARKPHQMHAPRLPAFGDPLRWQMRYLSPERLHGGLCLHLGALPRGRGAPACAPACMPALLQGQRPDLRPLAARCLLPREGEEQEPGSGRGGVRGARAAAELGEEPRASSGPRGGPQHPLCSAAAQLGAPTRRARRSRGQGQCVPRATAGLLRPLSAVPGHPLTAARFCGSLLVFPPTGDRLVTPPRVPLALLGTQLQPSPSRWPQQPLCAPGAVRGRGQKRLPPYGFVRKSTPVPELSADPASCLRTAQKRSRPHHHRGAGLPVRITLARSFNLCDPLFPHLSSGDRDTPLRGCSKKSIACPLPGAEQMLKMTGG